MTKTPTTYYLNEQDLQDALRALLVEVYGVVLSGGDTIEFNVQPATAAGSPAVGGFGYSWSVTAAQATADPVYPAYIPAS